MEFKWFYEAIKSGIESGAIKTDKPLTEFKMAIPKPRWKRSVPKLNNSRRSCSRKEKKMPHIKGMIEFDCDFDALAEDLERNGYVKVVRCKDCRFFKGDGLECHWGMFAYEDDYCSNGERREDAKIH